MAIKLGRVTSVFPDTNLKGIFVNVVTSPGQEPRGMPFMAPSKGEWIVPEQGDIVEVYEVDEGTKAARYPHTAPDFTMPSDLSEGDYCFRFNDNTEIRLAKQADGTFTLTIKADGDVTIETDADSTVNVNGGNVVLGDSANAVAVPVQNHTHPESGGGTTGTPNEAGTKTKIE